MAYDNLAYAELRRESRDDVHYRTRGTHADGQALQLVVVNLSPGGFMARCESPIAPGDMLRVMLPGIGSRSAQVKWALGGRIGCAFDQAVARADYYPLLTAMNR